MPNNVRDRNGLTLSTSSPDAAARWQEGLDILLSQNHAPQEKFQEAIDLDEGFALAHGYLAYWLMQRARPDEARETMKHALSLASDITRRERQQLEAVNHWINGRGPLAIPLIKEHLSEFPSDGLLLRLAHRLYMLGCYGSGVPNFPGDYLALLRSIAHRCEDDWAFLAEYAFAYHETGFLDEARKMAERSLALNSTNAVATHSLTHVYFEEGDAASGEDFLGNWLAGFNCPPSSYVHLSWHLALFELAQGKYQGALDRYENYIRPSVVAKSLSALNDSASLLWRLQIYCGAPPPKPWEEVWTLAVPAADKPGAAFRDAHAALALAASGDRESLDKLIGRLRDAAAKGNLLAGEMSLPLARGIDAFAQGKYADATRLLEPVIPQLTRIGGSHAQREVFEDTLLEAYLRAEQFDQAEAMLDERLRRRESIRDTFWLGRAQAGRGREEQARASLDSAALAWRRMGDEGSPEVTNLNTLAATLSGNRS